MSYLNAVRKGDFRLRLVALWSLFVQLVFASKGTEVVGCWV